MNKGTQRKSEVKNIHQNYKGKEETVIIIGDRFMLGKVESSKLRTVTLADVSKLLLLGIFELALDSSNKILELVSDGASSV